MDAYEKALHEHPRDDHRHGIVHCQIVRRDQIERMKKLKLRVNLQSIFLDYDTHIVRERVGNELASTSYPAKTLLNECIPFSNGSDAPVEEPNVMRGMECAVTRRSMAQRTHRIAGGSADGTGGHRLVYKKRRGSII